MNQKATYFILFLFFSLLITSCEKINDLLLTNEDVAAGLKEALNQGVSEASGKLGSRDGYLKDEAVKILLPPEVGSLVESAVNDPLIAQLDPDSNLQTYKRELEEKMNRGAEKAASKAIPIFANAITSMSISDAWGILNGGDTAATAYLRSATFQSLTNAFAPEINSALSETGATATWENLSGFYNDFVADFIGSEKINSNLGEYATRKALDGLFLKVAEEEKAIRNNPLKRGTELLKKVFQQQD